MRIVILVLLGAVGVANRVDAGLLALDGDEVNWVIGVNPSTSPIWTLGITNNTAADTERLSSWQVRLSIVPQAGATGILQFNTATIAATEYLLAGHSSPFANNPGDGSILRGDVGDPVDPLFGVQVPVSGKNLLDITFSSPNSAALSGTFNVVAWNGSANSIWTEITTVQQRGFAGLSISTPSGSPVLTLGTVTITPVPEPGTLAFCGLLTGLACSFNAGSLAVQWLIAKKVLTSPLSRNCEH